MAENAKQNESVEHIPAREHGKGFPPFDAHTFPSQLLWLALTFVALYLLMSRVALPRISGIFENRRRHMDGDLAEAQRLKDESDAALAAYEKSLADARSRAQSLANEERERETAAAVAARKELDATLNARIADAERAIGERKTAALANVQSIATEAATAIVERLTGTAPGAREVEAAVSAALKR
jgi:F-type H+-transporting ATPase subunit b